MKKALFAFSVFAAIIGCTLSIEAQRDESSSFSEQPIIKVASEEVSNPNVGKSIGTFDVKYYHEYEEEGIYLPNIGSYDYVAKISDETYMGFERGYNWAYDEEGNEYMREYAYLSGLVSDEEAITIPDSVRIEGITYPVTIIYSNYRNPNKLGFTENIKYLTVPATVTSIETYGQFDQYLEAMYMLGDAPKVTNTLTDLKLYVCNKDYATNYLKNDYFRNTEFIPYGWDYEWITVNVEKKGEFAETYLTQNNYDWDAAQYVKVIGDINDTDLSAIKNLTSLMKLDLSETSITSLPNDFMNGRRTLIEVKLPTTLKSIGNQAFYGCSSLRAFDLNGISTIGSNVFSGCTSLKYINLNGVETIGSRAFYSCKKLNNIDLSTVKYIGRESFNECSALESVDLSSAISIGFAISGENYITSYGRAFYNCKSLSSVKFGDQLQKINDSSFAYTSLESISLPESLTSLGSNIFERCSLLKEVTFPSTLTQIGSNCFSYCESLSNVSLNSGLITIGSCAFYGCPALEEIVIPASVKRIDEGAFHYTNIKKFICYAAVPPVASYSFIGYGMDMTRTYLYVPPFSKDFYRNTQFWSNFYLMRSIEEPVDYILVDRPLTINLEEEDNAVVANKPTIELNYDGNYVGQLTATGEGTLSAGQLEISGRLSRRRNNSYQYAPTLINYADKMRADNVTHHLSFYNYNGSGEWHFISLPYDVKVSDIVPEKNTHWVIRKYDSAARAAGELSSTWVNLTNDDILEAGKGYIVSAVSSDRYDEKGNTIYPTLTFTSGNSVTKNNIFRPTDVKVSLTEYPAEFAHNRSWNFVGNPYPCYFDMHFLDEDFTAPITVWNGNNYVAYSPVDDDLVLSPYEAFFVQCPLDKNEMTFKAEGRMHSDEGRSLYQAPSLSYDMVSPEERNVFNFVLSSEDQELEDRTRIVLNPEAKLEYEIGRDASKFFADSENNGQIYINADLSYSINERPFDDGIAVIGIRTSNEKAYILSLNGKFSHQWSVMLTDNLTGITCDLTKEDYQFIASSSDSSRFMVKFSLENVPTGIDAIVSDFGADANVVVTTLNGITVFQGCISDIHVPAVGLYLISNGAKTSKAILK